MQRPPPIRAISRYVVVGLAQNAVAYSLALALIMDGLKAWQAAAIIYPLAVVVTFTLNKAWTFAARDSRFGRYVFVYAAAYPATLALNAAQESSGVPSWTAALITTVLSAMGIFLALHQWVFRPSRQPLR